MKVQKVPAYLIATLAASLLSACGSSGVSGDPSTMLPQDNGGYYDDELPPSGGSNAAPMTYKSVGRPANQQQNGVPSTASYSMPLRTDTLLKVKVGVTAATRNENTPTYANFTANYNCATVRVTLQMEENGVYTDFASVDTDRLTVPSTKGCAGSVASQEIDFSGYMVPGHGNVRFKVEALTSDFDCDRALTYPYWPNPYSQILATCRTNPMRAIYQYHVVNGKLQAQVNGTVFN